MKTKTVKVHYCEHCKRRSFTMPSMKRHEESCGNNPERRCRMCALAAQVQTPLDFLKKIATDNIDEFRNISSAGMALLRKESNNCPACILSVIRQSGVSSNEFDWAEERKAFFADINESEREERGYANL